MDEPKPTPTTESTQGGTKPDPTVQASTAEESALARGSDYVIDSPAPERTEHSVMEGLPAAKAERVAAMRRELAGLQRQLTDAQQRIATELQGRADDAERIEALEARVQAQELEAQQHTTRVAELEREREDQRKQHRELTETLDSQQTAARDAKALAATRDTELAAMTSERDATKVELDAVKAEREAIKVELDAVKAERDATKGELDAVKAERDATKVELDAVKGERDATKGELEQARRELDAARAKLRDVANHIVRLGQELVDDAGVGQLTAGTKPKVAPTTTERPQPPPLPPPRAAPPTPPQEVEILEVTEEPKPGPRRIVSGLTMLGGVILGCAVTIAIMKQSSSSSTAAAYRQDPAAGPSTARAAPLATEPASDTEPRDQAIADQATPSAQPAPTADTDVNALATTETAPAPTAPTQVATDGAILLPPAADGHRVYVDGRMVRVKNSRAVVPCGAREVRIGSRGTAQAIDVACGGETEVPAETSDR